MIIEDGIKDIYCIIIHVFSENTKNKTHDLMKNIFVYSFFFSFAFHLNGKNFRNFKLKNELSLYL